MAKSNQTKFVDQTTSKIPHRINRVRITDLNPYLTCALCSGYLIDATTIVECLHTFCRACLLRYLETSDTCPICDTLINTSLLHKSIRSDQTLQDLVYKLIPSLYKSELQKRKEFCLEHCKNASNDASTSSKFASTSSQLYQIFDKNLVDLASSVCAPDEIVSFSLECFFKNDGTDKKLIVATKSDHADVKSSPIMKGLNNYKRYFRCPAAVKVLHLKKLLAHKLDLSTCHQVEIWHLSDDMTGDELMKEEWSLMDIALLYSWKKKSPLQLHFNVCKYDIEEEPMPELIREPEQQTPPSSSFKVNMPPSSTIDDVGGPSVNDYVTFDKDATTNGAENSRTSSSHCSQEFKQISPPLQSHPMTIGDLSPSPCQTSPSAMSVVQPAKLRLKKSLSSVVQQLNSYSTTVNNNNDSKSFVDQMIINNIALPPIVNGMKNDSSSVDRLSFSSSSPTTPSSYNSQKLPKAKKFKHQKTPIDKVTGNFLITNGSSGFIARGDYSSEIPSTNHNSETSSTTGAVNPERILCT